MMYFRAGKTILLCSRTISSYSKTKLSNGTLVESVATVLKFNCLRNSRSFLFAMGEYFLSYVLVRLTVLLLTKTDGLTLWTSSELWCRPNSREGGVPYGVVNLSSLPVN